MPTINEYLNRVRNLPPARLVPDLLKLLKRPNLDSSRIVYLLRPDKTLSAQVLRICNSAFYGAEPTEDLSEAVTRIGFQEAYRVVAASCGARLLGPPQPGYGMGQGELWRHSFIAATAAQLIARKLRADENLAFTAALMHDVGKIILGPALEAAGASLNKETEVPMTLVETERKLLGVEHAEMGGRLLERWNFPPEIVSAVWFHHAPKGAGSDRKLAALVYLGNVTACLMGHAPGHLPLAMRARSEAFSLLGLPPESLSQFILATFDQMQTPDSQSALAAA